MSQLRINSWIKTACGRAKYTELNAQKGLTSRIRLCWFVVFATIKDWNLENPDHSERSES